MGTAGCVDAELPTSLQFNGQYRNRVERSGGIKFTPAADTYDLRHLRLELSIQLLRWLTFQAETQDAEVSFSQKIPAPPPYANTWDLRQA